MSSIEKQHEDWDYQQLLEERQKLADEIKRLRAALREIVSLIEIQKYEPDWLVSTIRDDAKEALKHEGESE